MTRARSTVRSEQTPSAGGKTAKRVLLVEDDPVSLKLMRDLLQANGYATLEAVDGLEALDQAAQEAPDLVVMDVGLPGLDGAEVTRRLKADEATGSVPVLAVTAYAMPGDEERMRNAGCDAYLTKPLDFAEFLVVLRRLSQLGSYSGGELGTAK